MSCGPVQYECKSVHAPDVGLCSECAQDWHAWHETRGYADTHSSTAVASTGLPCPGFTPPGNRLAPFRPGEDEISDTTRSTLGRLFGGDIE